MIEIEQAVATDLAFGAKVKQLRHIDPSKFCFFSPDIPEERCVFLEEKFVNFGFGNSVNFLESRVFVLNLISEIPTKNAYKELNNNRAWGVFNLSNVKVHKENVKTENFANAVISIQNYLIELPNGINQAYIQFHSYPNVIRTEGQFFKQHALLHTSIYHSLKNRNSIPQLISIKATNKPIYVALVPGQQLQLITPENSSIDDTNISLLHVTSAIRQIKGERVRSTIYRCNKIQDNNEIIRVYHGKRNQSIINLPGILTNANGELFPYMTEPSGEFDIICNNMAGFVFTNMESGIKDWLYDNDIAYVESDDDETVVTFAKNQKYVTIEKTHGYWWLSTHPQYTIEKLT